MSMIVGRSKSRSLELVCRLGEAVIDSWQELFGELFSEKRMTSRFLVLVCVCVVMVKWVRLRVRVRVRVRGWLYCIGGVVVLLIVGRV